MHWVRIVHGSFGAITAVLGGWHRDHMYGPQSLKYLFSGPLQEDCVDPWHIMSAQYYFMEGHSTQASDTPRSSQVLVRRFQNLLPPLTYSSTPSAKSFQEYKCEPHGQLGLGLKCKGEMNPLLLYLSI